MIRHIELGFRVRKQRANNLKHCSRTTGLVLFARVKSKTIPFQVKRDREHLTVYIHDLFNFLGTMGTKQV